MHRVMHTYKTRQNIFVFCGEIRHSDTQVDFGKCVYCYYLYIWALPHKENDLHIVKIDNKRGPSYHGSLT